MSRADAPGDARGAAERLGRRAEALAGLLLRLKGYRIVARRLKTPVGEIDLAARRGRVLAVVEVKARAGHAEGAAAVDARSRARLARAAEWLCAGRPDLAGLDIRFDVVTVARGRPRHIVDAWRP